MDSVERKIEPGEIKAALCGHHFAKIKTHATSGFENSFKCAFQSLLIISITIIW